MPSHGARTFSNCGRDKLCDVSQSKDSGRASLKKARRIVVKIGTAALTKKSGRFHREHFDALSDDLLRAAESRDLIVVSSGAIALGVERLGWPQRPKEIPGKQACAAVGQSRLMRAYEEAFEKKGRLTAQVLLTHQDLEDRRRYRNAKLALERLLDANVVPIINENDTVSVDELKFGDNDTLAGLVAPLCGAEALVLLSDVPGLYSADPRDDPNAVLIPEVEVITPSLMALAGASGSLVGTGGMATKVRAAARAAESGIPTVIAAGVAGALGQVLEGETVGTFFHPRVDRRSARVAWIAHALRPRGKLVVDDGAREALTKGKKSLLPSGIRRVDGSFLEGDAVDLEDGSGLVFARGIAAYGAEDMRAIAGHRSVEIESLIGFRYIDEAVHRDDLALIES